MKHHARFILTIIAVGFSVRSSSGVREDYNSSTTFVNFYPPGRINITLDSTEDVTFSLNVNDRDVISTLQFNVSSKSPSVANVVGNSTVLISPALARWTNFSFAVLGSESGYADLIWRITDYEGVGGSVSEMWEGTYKVMVYRQDSNLDFIFGGVMSLLITLNNVNIGCQLQLNVVAAQLKKPVAPCIGLACQFLIMPLAAYFYGILLLDLPIMRLGLFTIGCSPGGTYSNFWTLLFKGDVDLSVTMTFVSTIAALGMMPLWMFTLGRTFLSEDFVEIPFRDIVLSLVMLTIPLGIGLLIQYKKPNWVKISEKIIKPLSFLIIIFAFIVGTIINWRVFLMLKWNIVLSAVLVLLTGYTLGAVAAFIARRPRPHIIAISIETGIQNIGIAFVLIMLTLPQPARDLATLPVASQAIFTSLPLLILYSIIILYEKLQAMLGGEDKVLKEKKGGNDDDDDTLKQLEKDFIADFESEHTETFHFDFKAPETVL